MQVIKAHVLPHVDTFHAVLAEYESVRTLTDETSLCVDAGSTLTYTSTVLALVYVCDKPKACQNMFKPVRTLCFITQILLLYTVIVLCNRVKS